MIPTAQPSPSWRGRNQYASAGWERGGGLQAGPSRGTQVPPHKAVPQRDSGSPRLGAALRGGVVSVVVCPTLEPKLAEPPGARGVRDLSQLSSCDLGGLRLVDDESERRFREVVAVLRHEVFEAQTAPLGLVRGRRRERPSVGRLGPQGTSVPTDAAPQSTVEARTAGAVRLSEPRDQTRGWPPRRSNLSPGKAGGFRV